MKIFHQIFQCLSFKGIENKHNVDRGKDCMKKLCEYLREHALKIIDLKIKKNEIVNKRAAGKWKNLLHW